MKANAPEKIYISNFDIEALPKNEQLSERWHEVSTQDTDIEYTRTDAFIEKAARFLEHKLYDRVEIQVWGTVIPSLTSKKAFIDEFVNYMEGEIL